MTTILSSTGSKCSQKVLLMRVKIRSVEHQDGATECRVRDHPSFIPKSQETTVISSCYGLLNAPR
jgi:hypothetical protein